MSALTFDHVKEKEMQLNLYNEPAIFMPHIQLYIQLSTVSGSDGLDIGGVSCEEDTARKERSEGKEEGKRNRAFFSQNGERAMHGHDKAPPPSGEGSRANVDAVHLTF